MKLKSMTTLMAYRTLPCLYTIHLSILARRLFVLSRYLYFRHSFSRADTCVISGTIYLSFIFLRHHSWDHIPRHLFIPMLLWDPLACSHSLCFCTSRSRLSRLHPCTSSSSSLCLILLAAQPAHFRTQFSCLARLSQEYLYFVLGPCC